MFNPHIPQRLQALRHIMHEEGLSAFIIPSTDPHLSEYVAPHWMSREWISGFNGSAGTVVVTPTEAGLWTDSRYFLQAAAQLEGTGIDLYKLMLADTPSISDFLNTRLQPGDKVGIDGLMFSISAVRELQEGLAGLSLSTDLDPFTRIWTDRPALPDQPAFVHELKYAGRSAADKLSDIRSCLGKDHADAVVLSALDEIAWALNIRGNDVHCNPVVISYLIVDQQNAHFFVDTRKINPEVADQLTQAGVSIHPYADVQTFLAHYNPGIVQLDPDKTNYNILHALSPEVHIQEAPSPVALLKAVRNTQEIAGLHAAMHRDGLAMVRLLIWLEKAVPQGGVTECGVDHMQHELRAQQPLYMGESFDTIAGYRAHGAIVHYEPTPETDIPVLPEGYLLLDSGAQYLDGTTDITRTIAVGPLTQEEKEDFTLILKCHIGLATAVFPEGTRGEQLDVLARMPIWKRRMNYLHGTGHGVGCFLNVHEGPQSIRNNLNPVTLQAGMTTTDEPGVYKAGSHGIRTENVLLVVPAGEGMFANYFRFETVTLCPICKKGIVPEMLTRDEIDWLNNYHAYVYQQLSPDLEPDEQEWLKQACQPIGNL